MSKKTANIVDAGISIVGSLGAGVAGGAAKAAPVLASEEASGMTTMQVLNTIEKGDKLLPTPLFNQVMTKAAEIQAGAVVEGTAQATGAASQTVSVFAKAAAMDQVAGTEGLHLGAMIWPGAKVFFTEGGGTPLMDIGAGLIGTAGGLTSTYNTYNSDNRRQCP